MHTIKGRNQHKVCRVRASCPELTQKLETKEVRNISCQALVGTRRHISLLVRVVQFFPRLKWTVWAPLSRVSAPGGCMVLVLPRQNVTVFFLRKRNTNGQKLTQKEEIHGICFRAVLGSKPFVPGV